MFAKLRKKIEEENSLGATGPGLASPVLPRIGPGGRSSPKAFPRKELTSSSSSNYEADSSVPTSPVTSEIKPLDDLTKEELIQTLMKKTDKVKFLENKLSEYIAAIKDHKKIQEKLELALEKQQNMSAKRTQELNETYQNNRLSLQASAEKKELELQDQIKQLEKEKSELIKKLHKADEFRENYFKQMEEDEEMQGFQMQEMAKVKHMLLNCQEELKKYQEILQERNDAFDIIENDKKIIDEEVKKLKEDFDILTRDRNKISSERDVNKNLLMELSKDKENLQKKIEQLTKDFAETSRRLGHFELAHSDLQDELDALKHTHDVYKNKSGRVLEEKDTQICHQIEKIQSLEKRLNDSNLSGDDKMQSLIQERDILEQRIEEARQQLSEIKSTWSEKINNLEQQISHLNLKIVEDNQQYTAFEKKASETESYLQKQIEELTEKLEENISALAKQTHLLGVKEQLLSSQESEWIFKLNNEKEEFNVIQLQLEMHIVNLEKQVAVQESKFKEETTLLGKKVEEFEKYQADGLEKEITWEKQLSELENTIDQQKKELKARELDCQSLSDILQRQEIQIEDLKKNVIELEERLKEQTAVNTSLQEAHTNSEKNLQEIINDKNQLLVRNAELSQQQQILKHDIEDEKLATMHEVEKTFQLQHSLIVMEEKLQHSNERIKELETHSEQLIENSNRVSQLKKETQDLQSQLNDRNKTIKMQQQRLGDLKKTLQRELKIQSLPTEDGQENNDRDILPSSLSSSRTSSFFINQSNTSTSQNDYICDEVSFRYLKHVVLTFMTSSEYEARQLVRAVSVVLRLSDEEERLIKQTLEWKMSWFGTKPQVSRGKTITGTL